MFSSLVRRYIFISIFMSVILFFSFMFLYDYAYWWLKYFDHIVVEVLILNKMYSTCIFVLLVLISIFLLLITSYYYYYYMYYFYYYFYHHYYITSGRIWPAVTGFRTRYYGFAVQPTIFSATTTVLLLCSCCINFSSRHKHSSNNKRYNQYVQHDNIPWFWLDQWQGHWQQLVR